MDEGKLIQELARDLQQAPRARVLYVEGPSDLDALFALFGKPTPPDGILDGTLVKRSGGVNAVRQRVELAARTDGLRGHFYGVIDGDGRPLAELRQQFDPPWAGPLFSWPAYNIESLLVRAGWPAAWGEVPPWHDEVADYAGFVALGKLHRHLQEVLGSLRRLARLAHPDRERIETVDEIAQTLEEDRRRLISGDDLIARFRAEAQAFAEIAQHDRVAALAALDGKWLICREAWRRRISEEECRRQWETAVREAGGLPEVVDLWERITSRGLAARS